MADLLAVAAAYDNAGVATVNIGGNANKAVAPFNKHGTRELSFLKITGFTGVEGTTGDANGTYAKVLKGVAAMAEVYHASVITNTVIVGVSTDTLSNVDTKSGSTESGTGYGLFEAAIDAATGGTSTVAAAVFA